MADGRNIVDPAAIEVIAPNFKRRLSGVTSTIIQLVPALDAAGCRIAVLGPGLPAHLPHIRIRDLWRLWRRPGNGRRRVWHARRNVEMLGGVVLRDILRMPLALLFTSASQRHHKRWTKFLISRMDAVIVRHVEALDPEGLMTALEQEPRHACGGGPMVAVMHAARQLGASEARVLRYADSGDVSGDKSSVVGYMAAAVS